MTDPLPADVRKFLENVTDNPCSALASEAVDVLARYPKPGPVWQPGDVLVTDKGLALLVGRPAAMDVPVGWRTDMEDTDSPVWCHIPERVDPLFVDGRRVYPARFHDHAAWLRDLADWLEPREIVDVTDYYAKRDEFQARLRVVADDIDAEARETG